MEQGRDLKEQVRDILESLRESEARETQFGVVESIGYSPEGGYYCLIEGIDQVVETGDAVGEVQVLSIDSEKVEFARAGVVWAQSLGAPPLPYWK